MGREMYGRRGRKQPERRVLKGQEAGKIKGENQEKRGREQEMHGTCAVRCKVREL